MISAVIAHLLIQIPLAIEWSETQGAAGAYSGHGRCILGSWSHQRVHAHLSAR